MGQSWWIVNAQKTPLHSIADLVNHYKKIGTDLEEVNELLLNN
jgi:hypothetical protein